MPAARGAEAAEHDEGQRTSPVDPAAGDGSHQEDAEAEGGEGQADEPEVGAELRSSRGSR